MRKKIKASNEVLGGSFPGMQKFW